MRNLFGGGGSTTPSRGNDAGRVPRPSSGWKELLKHLRGQESLRILDIGPTSSTNINYITNLGHSIYMANVVEEASKPEWLIPGEARVRCRSLPSNQSQLLRPHVRRGHSLGYGRLSA